MTQRTNRASLRPSYDYVIVGAGAAGCVLASELSASGAYVLLIESGGTDDAPTVLDPSVWFYNVGRALDYGPTESARVQDDAWSRPGWWLQHQRDGLDARPGARLRRMGAGRGERLGVQGCPADLQSPGRLGGRRHQQALNGVRDIELIPGPRATAQDVEDLARTGSASFGHAAGTCKMGIDDLAVVDPELRVHGLEHLRVADASIMPRVITGPTNAPTQMIAGKAAQLILAAR
jgi:choline dehydrogenase-like flavoprotein